MEDPEEEEEEDPEVEGGPEEDPAAEAANGGGTAEAELGADEAGGMPSKRRWSKSLALAPPAGAPAGLNLAAEVPADRRSDVGVVAGIPR